QIVALKFIGIPLKRISVLRRSNAAAFANALRAQRQTLEAKRTLLDQAIGVLQDAEERLRTGQNVDLALFKRIIEMIEMQNNTEAWKAKYDMLLLAKMER